MSRRKKQHGPVNHERWLVSYADFITLLFAFFVVLYASAVVDNKKIAQVSAAIQGGFQQLGAFSGATSQPYQAASANQAPMILPEAVPPSLPEHDAKDGGGSFGPPDVDKLKRELEQALGEEIQKHEIEMRVTPEGLVVSLHEVGFFNSGDATLLTGRPDTLTRIAKVLNAQGFHIRVEGHTDNRADSQQPLQVQLGVVHGAGHRGGVAAHREARIRSPPDFGCRILAISPHHRQRYRRGTPDQPPG